MQKISKIILQNFKFFYGTFEIPIERKNILLYGENGSGKSSIYWALYTFLQSVFKIDNLEIRKYFDPRHDENLINRFADNAAQSAIVIEMEDEYKALSRREISLTTINTKSDRLILETTLGSDFIDHKALSRIYAYYHKEEIDLFDFFNHELLAFINFREELIKPGEVRGSNNSEIWWEYISSGLTPEPKMHEQVYKEFQNKIKKFNEEFDYYLKQIEHLTNTYLKDRFQEKFKIKFDYKKATYNDFKTATKGRNWKIKEPQIILSVELITDKIIDPQKKIIDSPQSFLNEAKLSALSLALRFAILDEKFVAAYPKVLVLDDMLMSMDMSNREFILGMILGNYLNDYQILFFTHQRGLFEDAKKYIEAYHSERARNAGIANFKDDWKNHWEVYEMYESENANLIPIPQIQKYKSSLQKALFYFKEQIDYSACGNNLRAALEEYFRQIIPQNKFRAVSGNLRDSKKLMLHELLQYARAYFISCNYDTVPIDKLDRYRERSLNPASHYNPLAEFYKKELQEIFSILDSLKLNKRIPVIKIDNELRFEIRTANNVIYTYTAALLDDLNVYNKSDGNPNYYMPNDTINIVFTSCLIDGVPGATGQRINGTLQSIYNRMIPFIDRNGDNAIVVPDIYQAFTDINGNTLENLKFPVAPDVSVAHLVLKI